MNCPECGIPLDLAEVHTHELYSEIGRRRSKLRTPSHAGGAKPQPAECPKCGAQCESKGAARKHCAKARSTDSSPELNRALDALLERKGDL